MTTTIIGQTIAATSPIDVLGVLGIIAGMLLGFWGILRFVLNKSSDSEKASREERIALTAAIQAMAESTEKVAEATREGHEITAKEIKQGNLEAKQRNGHLAELTIQSNTQLAELINNSKSPQIVQNLNTNKE